MKSCSLILLVVVVIITTSCNQKLTSGKYVYNGGNSYFQFKENNSYYYFSRTHNTWQFSQGKIVFKKNEINFLPDSSFFFRISVSGHHFDPAVNGRKIILTGPDSLLNNFHFSFNNSLSTSVIHFNNRSVVYNPTLTGYNDGSITIKAQLNDSITIIPVPLHTDITSNTLRFLDVNKDDPDDKPWNVLELKVNIDGKMFAFTTLPPYLFKNKSLIEKRPIYKLTR